MTKLLPVLISALILAAMSEWNSTFRINQFGEKEYIKKDRFFFTIMSIVLIMFVGLRTYYNDTVTYIYSYEMMDSDWAAFRTIDWKIGANPGFIVINTILRIMGVSTQNFLMFYAAITIGTYLWFLRKYTINIWLTIFLFFMMGCYTFTMAAIKQCVAVAFCLIAVDRAIEKKWIPFVACIALASTFHPYSIMYAITPFLTFRPWSRKTFLLLMFFGGVGLGLQTLLGTLINVTTMLGEEYSMSSFSGEGVNVFRLAVVWVPVILSFITRKYWEKDYEERSAIIMNLTMINAEIMFIALFGTANYFARLANYFLIFQTLSLPRIFKYFTLESKKILTILAMGGYIMYFYYALGILHGGFDAVYRKIGLIEYLRSFL